MVIGGYWFGLINCLAYKIGFNKLSSWPTYFRKSCRHLNYRREYFTMTNTILINKIWSRYVYLVAQSCLTLCNPMNHSLPAFSVHGTSKARILEGLPLPSPGDLPDPGSNPGLLHWQVDSLPLPQVSPWKTRRSLGRLNYSLNGLNYHFKCHFQLKTKKAGCRESQLWEFSGQIQ